MMQKQYVVSHKIWNYKIDIRVNWSLQCFGTTRCTSVTIWFTALKSCTNWCSWGCGFITDKTGVLYLDWHSHNNPYFRKFSVTGSSPVWASSFRILLSSYLFSSWLQFYFYQFGRLDSPRLFCCPYEEEYWIHNFRFTYLSSLSSLNRFL